MSQEYREYEVARGGRIANEQIATNTLFVAADENNVALLQKGLDAGGDINAFHWQTGISVLMVAGQSCSEAAVDFLIKKDVSVAARTVTGKTAETITRAAGHFALADKIRDAERVQAVHAL